MIVFVFGLFNSCCINLNYEWNSLLKKIFFILLQHKNRFDFSIIKKTIFLIIIKQIWSFINQKTIFLSSWKQIWYFSNKKTLFYVINTDLNFYLWKPLFSTYHKTDLVFWQIKIHFFTNQKRSEFLNKRRDFIHK